MESKVIDKKKAAAERRQKMRNVGTYQMYKKKHLEEAKKGEKRKKKPF